MSHWYVEETSEWTLDYPPLFAWFQRLLAYPAALLDPATLYISKLPYKSPECVLFQRLSVVFTDAVLLSGLWLATRRRCGSQKKVTRYMVAANAGLLIVDHIHFQYNGLLLGILLWSIALIQEGRDVAAAFLFALLLNMKHLFAALAPLYSVYLLRHYCRGPGALYKFATVGSIVAAVFALSFGPFALMGQMPQLLQRLFPFHRGLLHAYWAPNLWALYAFMDKIMSTMVQYLGIPFRSSPASMTGGLVQVSHFSVLPDIGAGAAAAAVLASMIPLLVSVWRRPDPACFACCAALAGLNSFMLGYHVHEKAILMSIVPLALEAAGSLRCARIFQRLSTIGHYSLLPLIYTQDECILKMLMVLAYSVATCILLEQACTEGILEGQEKNVFDLCCGVSLGVGRALDPDIVLLTYLLCEKAQ
ncbi:g8885 [Coccomyxa viridis]|uniref:Alpha-1,3-glucosyltransferase n=1 Tax=Coccomyxa viridis TaxID=1274662 RepID=A0ABP1G1I5_9CHLO